MSTLVIWVFGKSKEDIRPNFVLVSTFRAPLLKSGKFWHPPYNMAKTSSYREKLPQNFLCSPFSMAKSFSAPLFRRGKTSRAPPSCFVAPPSPQLVTSP